MKALLKALVTFATVFAGILWVRSQLDIVALAAFSAFAVCWIAYHARRRNVLLSYDLEAGDLGPVHRQVSQAFLQAMNCSRKEFVCEGKLEGGFRPIRTDVATSSLSSRGPGVETNVTVPILTSSRRSIYLLPDCILVDDSRRSAKRVAYRDLVVEAGRSPVVETSPADDATVLFTSNAGGVAVALYDWIRLSSAGREIALIQLSKAGSALGFADALRTAGAKLVTA